MIRSAKYLLQPTKSQIRKLDHLLRVQRDLYNASLEERVAAWKCDGTSVTYNDQCAALGERAVHDPDFSQYGLRVARGTLKRLDLAYQAFYRRSRAGEMPGHPRFKNESRWVSVAYSDTDGWKLLADSRRFYAKGIGHVKVRMHRETPGRPKVAILKREGRRWFVIIQCDQVPPKPIAPTGQTAGIDLGISCLVTVSDGTRIANPRHERKAAKRLAAANRSLNRKQNGSARRRKESKTIASINRKSRHRRQDCAHKASKHLVHGYDVIIHEALDIVQMGQSVAGTVADPNPKSAAKRLLNRSIYDAGWGQLLRFITYKAEEAGREVIAVDPRNTSRRCAECGHVAAENRLTQAEFRCISCGHQANADVNAAINILRAGLAQRTQRGVREAA